MSAMHGMGSDLDTYYAGEIWVYGPLDAGEADTVPIAERDLHFPSEDCPCNPVVMDDRARVHRIGRIKVEVKRP